VAVPSAISDSCSFAASSRARPRRTSGRRASSRSRDRRRRCHHRWRSRRRRRRRRTRRCARRYRRRRGRRSRSRPSRRPRGPLRRTEPRRRHRRSGIPRSLSWADSDAEPSVVISARVSDWAASSRPSPERFTTASKLGVRAEPGSTLVVALRGDAHVLEHPLAVDAVVEEGVARGVKRDVRAGVGARIGRVVLLGGRCCARTHASDGKAGGPPS